MDTREAYKEKYAAQLAEWAAKLDVVEAQARKAKAQAKIDVAPHVDRVHEHYEAAKAKLEQVVQATDETWQDVKEGADEAWHDVQRSLEGALDALKAYDEKLESEKD